MTPSVLDLESLKNQMPADFAAGLASSTKPSDQGAQKPVSGAELVKRLAGLFTPEEADALARRIEEGREQASD